MGFVSQRQASDAFWSHFHVVGSEVEQYDSLDSMAAAADVVFLGRVTSVAKGRIFGDANSGNPEETQVQYATLTVDVERLLAGSLPSDTRYVSLEMIMFDSEITSMAANLPAEDSIFFLRNKGIEAQSLGLPSERIEEESSFYRLVIGAALLRVFDGHVVPSVGTDAEFLLALDGVPVDDVIAQITEASQG